MKRTITYSILLFLCLTIAFLAGYVIRGEFYFQREDRFPILNQAYDILQNHGYSDIPGTRALEYGMIRGMLDVYADPYSILVEPAQHELESNNLQGSFGGIGVDLQKSDEGKIVLIPFPGSPAEKAGITNGDQLFVVDNLVIGLKTPLDLILAAIRGEVGEPVSLTIGKAPNFEPEKLEVVREIFTLPSTIAHIHPQENRLGIIRVNLIAASTPEEISSAITELQKQGATHFVLDLRNNSGGLLSAGIETAKLFLEDGPILQQQYKGKKIETIFVESPGKLADIPLVILMNHSTASAAEIIAGALKQNHRAWLIGEPSYGKDSIQLLFDLEDGSSLHITSAKWAIPGLTPTVGGNGVQPDKRITDNSTGTDSMISAAREYFFP